MGQTATLNSSGDASDAGNADSDCQRWFYACDSRSS